MRVLLIGPPTHPGTASAGTMASAGGADSRDYDEAPLGVLTLAAVLESKSWPVAVVDANAWQESYLGGSPPDNSVSAAFALWLAAQDVDIFGFSTICSSFPSTLRLATRLRALRADARIVLGGPQVSVVDEATMREFRCVDYVVRGEADETFPRLLDEIAGGGRLLHFLPGITFRSAGSIRRTPPAAPIADLDALPLPASHLAGAFRRMSRASLELGRGCPFACRFCSTNDFFRRKFRLKSPQAVLSQMQAIEARYGTRSFTLVHDMFTVDRKAVVAFSEAMIQCGRYRWTCSARTDCVDPELLGLMAEAGCSGVFFGIETGSQRLQKIIGKDLDLAQARDHIKEAHRRSVLTTVSLITGFPDEAEFDFRETLDFILESARYDSVSPQLHLLAPLADTPIEREYRGRLISVRHVSDMSSQLTSEEEKDWIQRYPEIFPDFYALPLNGLDRRHLVEVRGFILSGLGVVRWLLVALHQSASHILDVYAEWQCWHKPTGELRGSTAFLTPEGIGLFLSFAALRYGSVPAIAGLVSYYRALLAWPRCVGLRTEESKTDRVETVPILAPHVRLIQLPLSLGVVLEHLREGNCGKVPPGAPAISVVRRRTDGAAEVLDFSALGSRILELCDGTHGREEIAASLQNEGLLSVVPAQPQVVTAMALRELQQSGLISFVVRRQPESARQFNSTSFAHDGAPANRP